MRRKYIFYDECYCFSYNVLRPTSSMKRIPQGFLLHVLIHRTDMRDEREVPHNYVHTHGSERDLCIFWKRKQLNKFTFASHAQQHEFRGKGFCTQYYVLAFVILLFFHYKGFDTFFFFCNLIFVDSL